MKSSSRLFPVQLIDASIFSDFIEDTYLLKPGISRDLTTQLAVTHLVYESNTSKLNNELPPIILLHPLFHNRSYWYSREGKGLAAWFAKQGYEVWLPELRGHGQSPVNQSYLDNSVTDFIINDLPAIQQFVFEKTHRPVIWSGVDFSVQLILASLGSGFLNQHQIAGCLFFNQRFCLWQNKLRFRPGIIKNQVKWRKSRFVKGLSHHFGPENEPWSVLQTAFRWASIEKKWKGRTGNHWENLKNIHTASSFIELAHQPMMEAMFHQLGAQQKVHHFIPFNDANDSFLNFDVFPYSEYLVTEAKNQILDFLSKTAEHSTSSECV